MAGTKIEVLRARYDELRERSAREHVGIVLQQAFSELQAAEDDAFLDRFATLIDVEREVVDDLIEVIRRRFEL